MLNLCSECNCAIRRTGDPFQNIKKNYWRLSSTILRYKFPHILSVIYDHKPHVLSHAHLNRHPMQTLFGGTVAFHFSNYLRFNPVIYSGYFHSGLRCNKLIHHHLLTWFFLHREIAAFAPRQISCTWKLNIVVIQLYGSKSLGHNHFYINAVLINVVVVIHLGSYPCFDHKIKVF